VVCKTDPAPRESSAVQQLAKRLPKPAGVSPPWCGNRTGNTEHFLPNEDARIPRGAYAPRSWLRVRMSLQIYASHQRARCFSHGGLTPPALGCMCGCHCRCTLRTNEYASFPTAGLRQPLLVDGDAMIRRIAVCNGQCMCTRVAMERSELADLLLLFARMHVHKSGDGVVVVPVSLALRLANFKRTCTRVRQLHCNYRQKQGQGLRISNIRAQAYGNFIAISDEDNAEACEFRFHVHKSGEGVVVALGGRKM
jgi:hypothetical protein